MNTREIALFEAVKTAQLEQCRAVLDQGADIDVTDSIGWTPLHHAANDGHTTLLSMLLDRGAGIGQVTRNEDTPLHLAAHAGYTSAIKVLLDRGAEISAIGHCGYTPLHDAAAMGQCAVAELLLSRGAQVDARDTLDGGTPLHRATENGRIGMARSLLNNGADLHAVSTRNQETPLHCAARAKFDVMSNRGDELVSNGLVELLLSRGARIEAKDRSGKMPLDVALSCGYRDTAKLLLAAIDNPRTDIRARKLGEAVYLSRWLIFVPLMGPWMINGVHSFCYQECWNNVVRLYLPALKPFVARAPYSVGKGGFYGDLRRYQAFGRKLRAVLVACRDGTASKKSCYETIHLELARIYKAKAEIAKLFWDLVAMEELLETAPTGKPAGEKILSIIGNEPGTMAALQTVLWCFGYFQRIPSKEMLERLTPWLPQWDFTQLLELGEIEEFLKARAGEQWSRIEEDTLKKIRNSYPWLPEAVVKLLLNKIE